jgi:hypothetical protein
MTTFFNDLLGDSPEIRMIGHYLEFRDAKLTATEIKYIFKMTTDQTKYVIRKSVANGILNVIHNLCEHDFCCEQYVINLQSPIVQHCGQLKTIIDTSEVDMKRVAEIEMCQFNKEIVDERTITGKFEEVAKITN